MPPLRLAILDDVAAHPGADTREVRRRLGKPRATVDRQLQALHMLGVLSCQEVAAEHRGQAVTRWRYTVASDLDPAALDPDAMPDLSLSAHRHTEREGARQGERREERDTPIPQGI